MYSMKSLGITAARFHFNLPNTTSSHSYQEREVRGDNNVKMYKIHTDTEGLLLPYLHVLLLLY